MKIDDSGKHLGCVKKEETADYSVKQPTCASPIASISSCDRVRYASLFLFGRRKQSRNGIFNGPEI